MAREPLIAPLPSIAPLVLAAVAGCQQPLPYEGAFQLPIAAAVLQPEVGGPFEEPVGFVANGHGGQIVPLALKQGRYLTDDPTVSFLRTNPLPTGGIRRLGAVAVVARSTREVEVWAADHAFGTLLRVPYLYDCEATPERPECEGAPPEAPVEQGAYYELLDEPGTASIADIGVKKGYTTTEEWTVTYDGDSWSVEGSRSGRQPDATTGTRYNSDLHRISFTLTDPDQKAEAGDTFVVRTESGLSEHGVGGVPLAVQTSPDQALLALIVQDRSDGRPRVRWFDPVAREVTAEVLLPPDAWPARLAWTEDGMLLATDAEHPAVWEIAPGAADAIEHPTPWPTLDVASLDGADRRRLYVVPADGSALWLFDRDTGEPIDVNAALEGDQGLEFVSTVTGIEALRREYWMSEYTDDAIRRIGRSVAVSLSSGRVVFAHEVTGCLVQDNLGPRTALGQSATYGNTDVDSTFATSYPYGPYLESVTPERHVTVNNCAGIAPNEEWTLTFDQNLQAWRVRATLSGEQVALAYEDERYLSDEGEVSFVIRSGATPSRDGWEVTFTVDDGAAEATGDTDGDGTIDLSLGVTADPVYFEYRAGLAGPIGDHEGEGWYPVDIRPFVLLPGASTDTVGRIDPQDVQIEIGWD